MIFKLSQFSRSKGVLFADAKDLGIEGELPNFVKIEKSIYLRTLTTDEGATYKADGKKTEVMIFVEPLKGD